MKKILYSIVLLFICLQTTVAQDWSSFADMPFGRHHPVTFTLDGYGYAATGSDALEGPVRDFYKYDPNADEWTILSQFPGSPRSFGIGFAYEGKGYLGFGSSATAYLKDIWVFDPVAEDWDYLTACPCDARQHPAFLISDGKIYVGLGSGANGNLNDWWEYDINANDWNQMPNIPGPQRHHPYQFSVKGELYTGMGHGSQAPTIYDDWYHFDQETSTWEVMNDFPSQARVAGTQFDHGDYGYVLSGDGANHSFMSEGEFWQYDLTDDSWTQFPSHPGISIWAPGSFVIEDTVYFFGGQNRQTGVYPTDAWKFQLPTPPVPEEPAGLAEANSNFNVNLFPIPASDFLAIQSSVEIESVHIINLAGQVVASHNNPNGSISVRQLPAGVYLAQVRTVDGDEQILRWVKAQL